MSQTEPTPSPPAPATDHSHMFDDDDDDRPSLALDDGDAQAAISLTPVRRSTNTLFLASPAGSEVPRGYALGGHAADERDGLSSDEAEGDRPSKRARTALPPALTAQGRPLPRTAESRSTDPFAELDDLDYTRRAPRFDGDGEDYDPDGVMRDAQTQSRNNIIRGEDLLDPMNMRRMRGNNGNGSGEDEPVVKARRVMPKLDADRLLGERGLPRLVQESRKFKIKGKGHEVSDLNNLLTMYQFWAHQMFPKSTFVEATSRVENLCHSRLMKLAMNKYYDDERLAREALLRSPSPIGSPVLDVLEQDGLSPQARDTGDAGQVHHGVPGAGEGGGQDEEDLDLDAMIAAAKAETRSYGNVGIDKRAQTRSRDPDEEDEEAMLGMELDMDFDASDGGPVGSSAKDGAPGRSTAVKPSLWGDQGADGDEDDWDALNAMEH